MITAAHIREGRHMAGISAREVARRAKISVSTMVRAEKLGLDAVTNKHADAILAAIQAAGVEFIPENGGGVGVRLSKGAAQ